MTENLEIPMLGDSEDGEAFLSRQIAALKAENERLTKERDDAREYGAEVRILCSKAEDARIHWLDRAEKAEAALAQRGETAPPASAPGAVKVKALDLSHLLRHAFVSGFEIAGGDPGAINDWWPEYDPETCPAYARILSAICSEAGRIP